MTENKKFVVNKVRELGKESFKRDFSEQTRNNTGVYKMRVVVDEVKELDLEAFISNFEEVWQKLIGGLRDHSYHLLDRINKVDKKPGEIDDEVTYTYKDRPGELLKNLDQVYRILINTLIKEKIMDQTFALFKVLLARGNECAESFRNSQFTN